MTDREEFEAWLRTPCPDDYKCDPKWAAYIWQAATAAALERAAVACEVIENDRWALYKGRPPYTGAEPGRADNYVQGESGGAGSCASAIRALKDET